MKYLFVINNQYAKLQHTRKDKHFVSVEQQAIDMRGPVLTDRQAGELMDRIVREVKRWGWVVDDQRKTSTT